MTWLMSKLGGLRLTLAQWVGVTAAAVIGYLVLRLRMQGSQLHATQVKLLESEATRQIEKSDDAVQRARDAYLNAKRAFEKADKP